MSVPHAISLPMSRLCLHHGFQTSTATFPIVLCLPSLYKNSGCHFVENTVLTVNGLGTSVCPVVTNKHSPCNQWSQRTVDAILLTTQSTANGLWINTCMCMTLLPRISKECPFHMLYHGPCLDFVTTIVCRQVLPHFQSLFLPCHCKRSLCSQWSQKTVDAILLTTQSPASGLWNKRISKECPFHMLYLGPCLDFVTTIICRQVLPHFQSLSVCPVIVNAVRAANGPKKQWMPYCWQHSHQPLVSETIRTCVCMTPVTKDI